MATYTFRSVGTTTTQRQDQNLTKSPIPIGIATPMQLDNRSIVKMHYNLADTVADNLRNLILTNHGERLIHHDFGANLKPILANLVSQEDFASEADRRISSAVGRWMPYVQLETFSVNIDHVANNSSNGTSVVKLNVNYSIPPLGLTNKTIELTMYAI